MKYRKMKNTGDKVSILGFGNMRFPTIEIDGKKNIDENKAIEMVRYAIDNGVNYIDTAWPYHNGESEPLTGKMLKDGYREKVFLATKLPSWLVKKYDDMDDFLNKQLERLQTDYIDYYLIHALNKKSWKSLLENGLIKFMDKLKNDKRVRNIGFSFHDDLSVFKDIVDSYDWDFCQIMYNYLDTDFQAGEEGLQYAYEKGLGIIIMEPLRGGKITTNIPKDIQKVWDKASPKRSPAEWALRWVWNDERVDLLLSGMSTMTQVEENIKIANKGDANSLTKNELALILEVKKLYKSKIKINCTDCKYCLPCPHGVRINSCFNIFNNSFVFNDFKTALREYTNFIKDEEKAKNCIECGECMEKCPQEINIIAKLKEVDEYFKKSIN